MCTLKDLPTKFDLERYTKSESVLGSILGALVNFCFGVAADCRGQLCILGEDLFPLLLPFWSKSSESVKVILLLSQMLVLL